LTKPPTKQAADISNIGKQSLIVNKQLFTKKPGDKGAIDPLLEP